MRLVVHMGFHKTASSYLQALLNRNTQRLAGRGIWYEPQTIYPAHHFIANPLLAGDPEPFAAMIRNGRAAGCHTILFSSENLEGLPFNLPVAALLEQVAAEEGITEIEWHAVIREPGAYFASIHSQLSWHTYADSLTMFAEVMKKGMVFLPEPHFGEGATPYWFFCFDYFAFLMGFAATGRRLFVHDYEDRLPYPGWRMIDRLGAIDALVDQPDEAESNHRLAPGTARDFFHARLREAAGDAATWAAVRDAVEANVDASIATVPVYAAAVGARYGDSYRQALAAFGARDERKAAA
ncbi:hypothetical protein [Sphingomonas sp.]|uniref:hypothetical protein n=1 Tax=Sphingomonas sp. TaxID=28214 RepID=UPI002C388478|nr:hypothetical protein [Sphingomonas sp.]HWK34870.1 hypothetical protein [Sphingomonas sp.]